MSSATKSFSSAIVMRFKLTLILLVASVVCVVAVSQAQPSFSEYKKKYSKSYTAASKAVKNETAAEQTYKANVAAIAKHNADTKQTYKQSVNANTDMTSKEVSKYRKGYKASKPATVQSFKASCGGKKNSTKKSSNLKFKSTNGAQYQKSKGPKITTTITTKTTAKGTTGKGTTGKGTTGKGTTGKGVTTKSTPKTTPKATTKTAAKKVNAAQAPTLTTKKNGFNAAGMNLKKAWPVSLDYSK